MRAGTGVRVTSKRVGTAKPHFVRRRSRLSADPSVSEGYDGMRIAAWLALTLAPLSAPDSAAPAGKTRSPILLSEFIDADAPYPQAHASTIVQLPDDTLAAAWFAGSGERRPPPNATSDRDISPCRLGAFSSPCWLCDVVWSLVRRAGRIARTYRLVFRKQYKC